MAYSSSHKHDMAFSLYVGRMLPVNWMGICTLDFLTPQMNIIANNQTLTIPLAAYTQSRRAIKFLPLLFGQE